MSRLCSGGIQEFRRVCACRFPSFRYKTAGRREITNLIPRRITVYFHIPFARPCQATARYERQEALLCCHLCSSYNPIIPQSSRPSAGMYYIITDKRLWMWLSARSAAQLGNNPGKSCTNLRNLSKLKLLQAIMSKVK